MSTSYPRSFGPSPTDPAISAAFVRAHEWACQRARALDRRCNAEDIAQEVMFALNAELRGGAYLDDDAGLRQRVESATRAAVQTSRRTDWRRAERDHAYFDDSAIGLYARTDIERRFESAELLARVRRRLARLRGKHLQVFDLLACGFSYREAAEKLAMRPWTVREYQHDNLAEARLLIARIDERAAQRAITAKEPIDKGAVS